MNDQNKDLSPSYTEEDRELLARVKGWINPEEGRDQASLSRKSGVAAGTLSQVLSGGYPSSPTKWLQRLADVVDREWERQRQGLSRIPFCETKTTRNIIKVIERAHRDRDFGTYMARVGCGKTTAIRRYAETHKAVVLDAFDGIDHSTVIRELAEATGAKVATSATLSAKIAAIIRALRGTDTVILIDEAGRLPDLSLGALRRISDIAEVGCVLIGNPELERRIADPDGRFGQITSRIGFWPVVLTAIPADDLAMMARAFLAQAGEEAGDDVISQLVESCQGSGRALEKLLRNTLRSARARSEPVTAALVKRVDTETFRGVH